MSEEIYMFMTVDDKRVFCEAREVTSSSFFGLRKRKYWVRVVAPWLINEAIKMPVCVDSLEQAKKVAVDIRLERISIKDLVVAKKSDRERGDRHV